ncbi:PolC-type DNA polymerase III [Syntrophomonas wolfei]|jgi:DNA polymerase-3 subunit alpha (Gram-positive type)|nr:PolC-type DNA polymerase III [Syntrophomonas wolfei]
MINGDFYSFISNFNDSLSKYWKDSYVEKLEVFRSNKKWKIYVAIMEPLPAHILQQSIVKLKDSLPFLNELEIIPRLADFGRQMENILRLRQNEVLSEVFLSDQADFASLGWRFNENRIDMLVQDRNVFNKLLEKESCNRLSRWIGQEYALRVVVRAICTENNEDNVPDNYYLLAGQKIEVLAGDTEFKGRKKRYSSRNSGGIKLLENSGIIKISELQEGMKNAVIEGEVWHKEINSLKDNSIVAAYYISDYSNSIVAKLFLDKVEDDKIKLGDWIKLCGSIRYDNYVKEAVLFIDAFVHLEKPERKDTATEKRIELHAHSKMSAMDGLTEVSKLIKRAAEWQHPAIALTDHGSIQAFPEAYQAAKKYKIKVIYGVEAYLVEEDKKERPYHIVLLALNQNGLKNLYHLVSISYMDYFYRYPKIPRQELIKKREGLLLGSACEAGELFRAMVRGAKEKEIEEIAGFYDYLEIQPLDNNDFLVKEGSVKSREELQEINRRIIRLGQKFQKPVAATGDVHFLDPHHEIFRRIIQAGQGYEDAESQAPLYFRSTDEMLAEMDYLSEEEARAVVIHNPALIAEMIEDIRPVPEGFYPPKIESAAEEVTRISWDKAYSLYGDELPTIVESRIMKELNSITHHGFSVLYLIAHKLVEKSNQDGYIVGSRGSVGSSLVAFLTGITEVNPLAPHYLCPLCRFSDFVVDGSANCGADLPERSCPECGGKMHQDGFDIPFETFLGFEGDKVPDIDLNFSGDYQSRAHQYVEELFGQENVYRAGTISTIAEKTAYGFVKKYMENKETDISNAEVNRLVKGITGVRRTTGQHPGGLIVVPQDRDILEFTPLQHPADNKDSGVITTHFEYHAIGEQLVKLDILGHDDPTVLKELEDLTGRKASSIKLNEKETMKLFSGVEPLGLEAADILSTVGTYGIPEFGTRFVRQMLEATRPTTFSELVRISGLSHGTNVWLNNAQNLIKNGTAGLSEVICTRDDIMSYLIQKGLDKKQAFKIMENVRKGNGLNSGECELMAGQNVPSWYIDSCQKIEYMFPKAHAVAYVTMAFRIAYFKVYYPLPFYASFFSIRAEDFDSQIILEGYEALKKRIQEIEKAGLSASQKDKKLLPVLEVAMEMYARGFTFQPVDIYESDASKFLVVDNALLLPFSALPNVGAAAAHGIIESREGGSFISVEDFQQRSRLNKTAMEVLRKFDCFNHLPETSQVSLFG